MSLCTCRNGPFRESEKSWHPLDIYPKVLLLGLKEECFLILQNLSPRDGTTNSGWALTPCHLPKKCPPIVLTDHSESITQLRSLPTCVKFTIKADYDKYLSTVFDFPFLSVWKFNIFPVASSIVINIIKYGLKWIGRKQKSIYFIRHECDPRPEGILSFFKSIPPKYLSTKSLQETAWSSGTTGNISCHVFHSDSFSLIIYIVTRNWLKDICYSFS